MKIQVTKNGPYFVTGALPLAKWVIVTNETGESVDWEQGERFPDEDGYALCRCGRSKSKPFCDGSHATAGFDGTETATREPYADQAVSIDGPAVNLRDARKLCAEARFCDRDGGLWERVKTCQDPETRADVERQASQCPAGRYTACDAKTGEPHEPDLEPSIGLIEDPYKGVSGPAWVRGGVPVESADGEEYEVRNRVTLCRCGHSCNKPFCDGSHIAAGFTDEE